MSAPCWPTPSAAHRVSDRPSGCPSVGLSVRLSVCLSFCFSACSSVRPSTVRPHARMPVRLSVSQSACTYVCLSVCPSVRLSIRPPVCPSVRPSVICPSIRPSVRPSIHPSVRPSVRPSVCRSGGISVTHRIAHDNRSPPVHSASHLSCAVRRVSARCIGAVQCTSQSARCTFCDCTASGGSSAGAWWGNDRKTDRRTRDRSDRGTDKYGRRITLADDSWSGFQSSSSYKALSRDNCYNMR